MNRSSRTRNRNEKKGDPRLQLTKQFGGSLLKNSHAKKARHLSTKHALHVVLKSSYAKGEFSLRANQHRKDVQKIIHRKAQSYGIKIYEFANVGDHIQLVLRLKSRKSFAPFIRAITGAIALKVSGASKNKTLEKILSNSQQQKGFWDYRPWTRILEWTHSYDLSKDQSLQEYLHRIGMLANVPQRFDRYFLREDSA